MSDCSSLTRPKCVVEHQKFRNDVIQIANCVLISGNNDDHFTSIAEGLRGYHAHHNSVMLLNLQDRHAEAEHHSEQALKDQPHCIPDYIALIQGYAQLNRAHNCQSKLVQLTSIDDRYRINVD